MGCELENFERVARLYCRRWEQRSLDVVRDLLINMVRLSEVAEKYNMKPQQVIVLRARFNECMRRESVVKMSAENFMHSVPPESESIFKPFISEIKKLVMNGYSEKQISEYLTENGVNIPADELTAFLRKYYEKYSSGKSKRRGR